MNYKCDKSQFIAKSKALFGNDAFDYSKVEYVNAYTEVVLICKKHGEFSITPSKHLKSVGGCPKCSIEKRAKRKSMTTEQYKELCIKKYGNKYALDKIVYNGMREKITVGCPIHGDFSIVAYDFLHKRECPKCGRLNRVKSNTVSTRTSNKKLTTEEFVKRSKGIHGDKYDYSLVEYNGNHSKVCIICPTHGEFWQSPSSHMKGVGCPKCGKESAAKTQSYTTNSFIEKANLIHKGFYDYSMVKYTGCYNKVDIICPIHGVFSQSPTSHLNGHGCPKCMTDKNSKLILSNTTEFISKALTIHKDEGYDYSKVDYKGAKVPVRIKCKNGHEFWQIPNKHLEGHGCPYCINIISKPEQEIRNFIQDLGLDVQISQRNILEDNKEIDIFIPSKNIAIEFDGLYWHNEKMRPDKRYHLQKTENCEKQGIRLIHIFEDEWLFKKDIVKSRLKNILGMNIGKVYARNCTVENVESNEAKNFLEENHIQGNVNSSIRYGLYFYGELVSLMSFGKTRKNLGGKSNDGEYELLRFCSKLNTNVVGGASKLFNHFIKEIKPNKIISYSDRRWNTGKLYETLGFELTHITEPNYFYIIGQQRHNRFNFRKDKLVSEGYDAAKSEHEIMLEREIYRIYDCGCYCYCLYNNKI